LLIDTLGELRVQGPLSVKSLGPRALRLLCFLLSVQGHLSAKEYIAESLWPDNVNNTNNLHAAAHDLRLWLGDAAYLELSSGQYLLGGVMVDADEFESRCRGAIALEPSDHGRALNELGLAAAAYTGPFLPHISDHWVTARRQQLEELFLEATAICAEDALSMSEFSRALCLASTALSVNHLREDVMRLRMKALAGLGRRPEAILGYERFRVVLARELQCRPDPVTRELHSQLSAGITLRTADV
jgi:DNA-binding SARP family transcriptional activator